MSKKKLARVALKLEDHGNPAPARNFFARRRRDTLIFLLAFIGLTWISSAVSEFNFIDGFSSFPKAFEWLIGNFVPDASTLEYLPTILSKLLDTVLLAVLATTMAACLAFCLAIFVARATAPNKFLAMAIRAFATVIRSIPLVAWAMIFLLSFGQSNLTGLLAIFLESLGFFIRAFAEAIDETAGSSTEALRASGASWIQTMAQSVLPSVMPQLISWSLYMVETNIRNATLVGILTGTGIGFAFNLYYKTFRYPPAALVVLVIVLVVLLIEQLSNKIRREIL